MESKHNRLLEKLLCDVAEIKRKSNKITFSDRCEINELFECIIDIDNMVYEKTTLIGKNIKMLERNKKRGRPIKYSKEEAKERKKESRKKWENEHKKEQSEYRKEYYQKLKRGELYKE